MKHSEHHPQGECPHPGKMAFRIKKMAKLAARKRPGTRIYKCECGRFHLYTKDKREREPAFDIFDQEIQK